MSRLIINQRYELKPDEGIKKGRYATLYKATDKKTGKWVTVKFTDEAQSGYHCEPFKKKWQLIKHPNLLRCLDRFDLVTNLGEGEREFSISINEYLRGGPISHHYSKFEDRIFLKPMISRILSGLDFLHSLNLIHRDIKCANIFLFNDEKGVLDIKLTDMDMLGEVGQNPQEFIGTPEYSAPEVFLMKPLNKGSDFWSLGCVLFELLTKGALPFGSRLDMGGIEVLKERILRYAHNKSNLAPARIALIDSMLDKNVDTRLTDSRSIIAQL